MFLRNKINFVTLKLRFGGTRSRLPRNGYIRPLGETSWGPPGRKLCYVKLRFGGTRSRLPRNGYIRQLGETSWGPPGRKLCYVKSHFGGTRSRFPRNGYIRQSGESCRVEARQGETSRGPPRLATNESTPQLASPRLVSIAKKADSSRLASPRLVDSPSRLASCSSLPKRIVLDHISSITALGPGPTKDSRWAATMQSAKDLDVANMLSPSKSILYLSFLLS